MAAEEKDDPTPPEGGGKKKLVLVGGAVVLLAGGLAGGYFAHGAMAGTGASAPEAGAEKTAAEPSAGGHGEAAPEGEEGAPVGPAVTELGTFTVNLRDGGGGRLLQMTISVEAGPAATAMVAARTAQLRDATILLASDYTYIELEGLDGKMRMRDEIQRRINAVLEPQRVDRVYFTAFVVQ